MLTLEGPSRYLAGALRLLQFVEARRPTGRRFGADADARWHSFRGDLRTAERIELLLRDADAEWPGGFGARTVYGLRAVAEDEPFGSQWPPIDPIAAEELWRALRTAPAPTTAAEVVDAVAAAWDLVLSPHAVGAVAPTDRLIVVGPSAVAAMITAFAAGAALDWAEQVTVIATPPAHRHVAAAATAALNLTRAFPLRTHDAPGTAPASARLLASPDADPRDHAAADAMLTVAART
ncbi:MAG: hypothetical protein IPL61_25660 [Myxococcales bacterium]|nr:hypothetical protein [Myxococcales bacterium]